MTESTDNMGAIASRLAGKWQVPLLLLGVVAVGVAALVLVLRRPTVDWDQAFNRRVAGVEAVSDGDYTVVARAVAEMLNESITPKDNLPHRAKLHALGGEIGWRNIQDNKLTDPRHWRAMREAYMRAIRHGQPKTAEIAVRLAEAAGALERPADAIAQYKEAARLDTTLAAEMSWRIIEIRRGMPEVDDDVWLEELTHLLELSELASDKYAWALDRAVGEMIDRKLLGRARHLVGAQLSRGLGEAHNRQVMYQQARVLAAEGLTEQADNILITLVEKIEPALPLYVKSLLLRGELIWDENPRDAEALFSEVISRAANTPIATAATIGLAKTFGQMQLHDKALDYYAAAVSDLSDGAENPYVSIDELLQGLVNGHNALRAAKKHPEALRFVQLEQDLAEVPGAERDDSGRQDMLGRMAAAHMAMAGQVADEYRRAVDSLAGDVVIAGLAEQRTEHLQAAGDAYMELATEASRTNDELHGDSLWTAASAYDQAGLRDKAVAALKRFIVGRPGDERIPEARFVLGRTLQASGEYDEAIRAYKTNLETRIPGSRHIKAVEGLIPMARCYIAKGPEFFGEAEKILHDVTNDQEGITPGSELYRQALFGLGRLYHSQGKWRQARRVLTEAVQRDPGKPVAASAADPQGYRWRYVRATQSQYYIADSYQHSAREMTAAAMEADVLRRRGLRARAKAQLERAAALHAEVIDLFEALGGDLDATEQAFRRCSYFALGDCMFELGRYPEALERYEKAVFLYQRRPEALGGLIAIYNCHIALGRLGQAQASMERAEELRKHVKYADGDLPEVQTAPVAWNRWLEAVAYLNPEISDEE